MFGRGYYDVGNNAFEDGGGDLEGTNNPTPGASDGDYTEAQAIPEFGDLFVPIIAVVVLLFVVFRRKRKISEVVE